MFDYAKFQSHALAAIGAIILTGISVGAAVGPAQVNTAPVYMAAAEQTVRAA